jgi:hypothetical protein
MQNDESQDRLARKCDKLHEVIWEIELLIVCERGLKFCAEFLRSIFFSAIILSISCSLPRPKLGKLLSSMFSFGLVTNTVQTRSNWHVNIIAVQAM